MEGVCFLNGEWLALEAAKVSPLDRGFLFGDGVYEVVKVRAAVPLFVAAHVERLGRSLAAVRIPADLDALAALFPAAAARNQVREGLVYLQVTRGAGARAHLPPPGLAPTVFACGFSRSFSAPAASPLAAITRPDGRWSRCDVKAVSLLAGVLGKLEAADEGAAEVLFCGPGGRLREGGNTNVFVRRGEVLETHPLGPAILAGVTRRLVLDAARAAGLPVASRAPRLAERASWREVFVCGTATGVQAVTRLDGTPVGDGAVGPWTRQLAAALEREELAAAAGAGR